MRPLLSILSILAAISAVGTALVLSKISMLVQEKPLPLVIRPAIGPDGEPCLIGRHEDIVITNLPAPKPRF